MKIKKKINNNNKKQVGNMKLLVSSARGFVFFWTLKLRKKWKGGDLTRGLEDLEVWLSNIQFIGTVAYKVPTEMSTVWCFHVEMHIPSEAQRHALINARIVRCRRECIQIKRQSQRRKNMPEHAKRLFEYKHVRKKLRWIIVKSKSCFKGQGKVLTSRQQ